jgi:hypothetical protein
MSKRLTHHLSITSVGGKLIPRLTRPETPTGEGHTGVQGGGGKRVFDTAGISPRHPSEHQWNLAAAAYSADQDPFPALTAD